MPTWRASAASGGRPGVGGEGAGPDLRRTRIDDGAGAAGGGAAHGPRYPQRSCAGRIGHFRVHGRTPGAGRVHLGGDLPRRRRCATAAGAGGTGFPAGAGAGDGFNPVPRAARVAGATTGGAKALKPAMRVVLWGALAMALTAGIGVLAGKVMQGRSAGSGCRGTQGQGVAHTAP